MQELTIKDIVRAILDHIVLVVLIPAAAVTLTAFVCWNLIPATYTAETSIYVLNRTSDGAISYTDVNTSTLLVKDYEALAKSNRVQDGAAELLGLEDLEDFQVFVSSESSTRLIYVNVEGREPAATANVANAIAAKLSECIVDVMKVENISIIDSAVPPEEPSGPNALRNMLIAGVIGLIISIGTALVLEVINTSIRTSDDVETLLGLPVLAQIPHNGSKR